jgi:hypothetical protein
MKHLTRLSKLWIIRCNREIKHNCTRKKWFGWKFSQYFWIHCSPKKNPKNSLPNQIDRLPTTLHRITHFFMQLETIYNQAHRNCKKCVKHINTNLLWHPCFLVKTNPNTYNPTYLIGKQYHITAEKNKKHQHQHQQKGSSLETLNFISPSQWTNSWK